MPPPKLGIGLPHGPQSRQRSQVRRRQGLGAAYKVGMKGHVFVNHPDVIIGFDPVCHLRLKPELRDEAMVERVHASGHASFAQEKAVASVVGHTVERRPWCTLPVMEDNAKIERRLCTYVSGPELYRGVGGH